MKYNKEIKIGIIFAIAAAMFFWGFNYLKGLNILSSTKQYFIVYDNIMGLSNASPVTVRGISVGNIEKFEFTSDNKVCITIGITKKYKIAKGTIAKLYNFDIMGTRAINLDVPSSATIYHNEGDTLASMIEKGTIDQIISEFNPIKDKANELLTELNTITSNLAKDENTQRINHTLENLEKTSYSISSILAKEQASINGSIENIEKISRMIVENNEKISNIIGSVESIGDSIKKAEISQLINNTNASMKELALILNKANEGKGTLGKIVNDDSLYFNLSKSLASLEILLTDLQANPKNYVHFSVFGKKTKLKD